MPVHRPEPLRPRRPHLAGLPLALVPALGLALALAPPPARAAAADTPPPASAATATATATGAATATATATATGTADTPPSASPTVDTPPSASPTVDTPPPASPTAADTPAPRGSAHMGVGVAAHDGVHGLPLTTLATQTEGVDVSSHQGDVAWSTLWNSGVKWAYVKATEGTYYKNPHFTQQYNGSHKVGMIRGAYHFATPDTTNGATQADYFVDRGGGWSHDGKTLPGALDIEWNPYGDACYGKSPSGMVTWIRDFLNRYKARTGRDAVIYTATNWWKQCTGNYSGFASANPLWIARYASTVGELPAGWSYYTMWQYTSSGPTVGDHNRFNGALDRLRALANG